MSNLKNLQQVAGRQNRPDFIEQAAERMTSADAVIVITMQRGPDGMVIDQRLCANDNMNDVDFPKILMYASSVIARRGNANN